MDENIFLIAMVIMMSKNNAYKPFIMEDVFELFTGALISKEKIKKGNIPRITATETNNGITLFTNEINDKNFRTFDNFISISFLGNVFYQKNKASLDMKIHGIKPKNNRMNKYIAQFLIPLLRNFSLKYSYGNQLSMRLLKRQKINLPITSKEQPDWEYMETFGKYLYYSEKSNIKEYLKTRCEELNNYILKGNYIIDKISWKAFRIDEIVNVKSGVRLTKKDQKSGKRPFIGATEFNNGITNFVSNTNESIDYNILGVNYNGAVVESFYHPYEAIFSDDVKRIEIRNKKYRNKYTYLFLATSIEMQKKKFMYSYKFNAKRMKNQYIILPITEYNEPDWKYMEHYMMKIEYKQLTKLIEYLN